MRYCAAGTPSLAAAHAVFGGRAVPCSAFCRALDHCKRRPRFFMLYRRAQLSETCAAMLFDQEQVMAGMVGKGWMTHKLQANPSLKSFHSCLTRCHVK
jgi:hypothetical protein